VKLFVADDTEKYDLKNGDKFEVDYDFEDTNRRYWDNSSTSFFHENRNGEWNWVGDSGADSGKLWTFNKDGEGAMSFSSRLIPVFRMKRNIKDFM
jgi:hypothetical protein